MLAACRKRVLIVEDETFVAEVVQSALEDEHEVIWAADVPGALASIHRHRPDAVLVDCVLPGGRLPELLAGADVYGLPVVMISGHPDVLGQYVAFGYPCLAKPFDLAEMLDVVERALSGRWEART